VRAQRQSKPRKFTKFISLRVRARGSRSSLREPDRVSQALRHSFALPGCSSGSWQSWKRQRARRRTRTHTRAADWMDYQSRHSEPRARRSQGSYRKPVARRRPRCDFPNRRSAWGCGRLACASVKHKGRFVGQEIRRGGFARLRPGRRIIDVGKCLTPAIKRLCQAAEARPLRLGGAGGAYGRVCARQSWARSHIIGPCSEDGRHGCRGLGSWPWSRLFVSHRGSTGCAACPSRKICLAGGMQAGVSIL